VDSVHTRLIRLMLSVVNLFLPGVRSFTSSLLDDSGVQSPAAASEGDVMRDLFPKLSPAQWSSVFFVVVLCLGLSRPASGQLLLDPGQTGTVQLWISNPWWNDAVITVEAAYCPEGFSCGGASVFVPGYGSAPATVAIKAGPPGFSGSVIFISGSGEGLEWHEVGVAVRGNTVTVTPDALPRTLPPNTPGMQEFTVTNSGTAGSYTLTHNCGSSCTLSASSVSLTNGESKTVTLSYPGGPASSVPSVYTVTAKRVEDSSVTDVGSVSVTRANFSATPALSSVTTAKPGVTDSLKFTITSSTAVTEPVTVALHVNCQSSPLSNCAVTPSVVSLSPGGSATAWLKYVGGAPGSSGPVQMAVGMGNAVGYQSESTVTFSVQNALGVELEALNPGTEVTRSLCLNVSAGAGSAYECGDLRLAHGLPVTTAMNTTRAPTLLYNSQHASPMPVVAANVWLPTGVTLTGQSLTAVLKVAGTERANTSWSLTGWSGGQARRIALGFDASALATGVYDYTLEVKLGTTTHQQTKSGKLVVVNRSASPYGAGWWVAGVEQLVASGSSWLWIGGDGSTRLYQPTTTSNITKWVAINPDRSADTLSLASSQYTRRLPDKTQVIFNSSGRQITTTSRLGQKTDFTYDSSGRLTAIKLAAPTETLRQSYTISWGTGTYTVTAPGSRSTVVTLGSGRVTGIKDPDNLSIQFGYATTTSRQVTRRTDKLGVITTYGYTAEGSRLAAVVADSGASRLNIRTAFTPSEVRGLRVGNGTGLTPAALTDAMTLINGPRTDTTVTRIWTDRYGAPTVIRDALGAETKLFRGDARFPALVTEAKAPNGYTTRAAFDVRGNPVRIVAVNPYGDGRDAITSYEYADAINPFLPTKITEPEGEVTRYSYLSNGNVAWQQSGSDTSRRWTYTYNTSGQLWKADPPGPPAAEVLEYDERGNLKSSATSMGFKTLYQKDALGRDTSVVQPQVGTNTRRQSIRYDTMGRVLSTRDIGIGDGVTIWNSVTHSYDVVGNRTESKVWGRSGTADSIPGGTSSWVYDRVGRVTISRSPASVGDTLSYDAAGNVRRTASPGNPYNRDIVTMAYDALNRLVTRIIPEKYWGQESYYDGDAWLFPAFVAPNGLMTIPADTQRYTYDPGGKLLTANNRYAKISRSYYLGGALKTDSSAIRDYSGTGFSTFVYGLGYSYDRNGRQTAVQHPSALIAGSTKYAYSKGTGELTGVTDPLNGVFSFTYDVTGLPTSMGFPGGTQSMQWNADGRRIGMSIFSAHGGTRSYGAQYDALGRFSGDDFTYDAMGYVIRSVSREERYSDRRLVEQFRRDPFGNVLAHRSLQEPVILPPAVERLLPDTSQYLTGGRITRTAQRWSDIPVSPVYGAYQTLPQGWEPDFTNYVYDERGNLVTTIGEEHRYHDVVLKNDYLKGVLVPGPAILMRDRERSVSMSWYGADGKLMVHQVSRDSTEYLVRGFTQNGPLHSIAGVDTVNVPGSRWGVYEEYWYDALGRRVLKRSRQEAPLCLKQTRCQNSTERTVWDGDQVLWEIRDMTPTGPVNPPAGLQTGKIGYIHAGGIDEPLGLIRNGTLLVPHRNLRGLPTFASDAAGWELDADLVWPGGNWTMEGDAAWKWEQDTRDPHRVRPWYGSLMIGQADASGLQYKRNRYYSPESGQFTQPDPIGIAGGLNVYGYANGDPVNFRDPFGLFEIDLGLLSANQVAQLQELRRRSSTFDRWYREADALPAQQLLLVMQTASNSAMRENTNPRGGGWTFETARNRRFILFSDDKDIEGFSMGFAGILAHEMSHAVAGLPGTGVPSRCLTDEQCATNQTNRVHRDLGWRNREDYDRDVGPFGSW
jgi:RHS repeat-associated protein